MATASSFLDSQHRLELNREVLADVVVTKKEAKKKRDN
jgi:hypothetical protein